MFCLIRACLDPIRVDELEVSSRGFELFFPAAFLLSLTRCCGQSAISLARLINIECLFFYTIQGLLVFLIVGCFGEPSSIHPWLVDVLLFAHRRTSWTLRETRGKPCDLETPFNAKTSDRLLGQGYWHQPTTRHKQPGKADGTVIDPIWPEGNGIKKA